MAAKAADDFAFIKSKMAKDIGLAPLSGAGRVKVKVMSGVPDVPGRWLYLTQSGGFEICTLERYNIEEYKKTGSGTKWIGLLVLDQ